jgi:hypothetical protein
VHTYRVLGRVKFSVSCGEPVFCKKDPFTLFLGLILHHTPEIVLNAFDPSQFVHLIGGDMLKLSLTSHLDSPLSLSKIY